MPFNLYVCEKCGFPYRIKHDAELCEMLHDNPYSKNFMNTKLTEAMRAENHDPCFFCKNGYYVYNCEFECDEKNKCTNYSMFEPKPLTPYGMKR